MWLNTSVGRVKSKPPLFLLERLPPFRILLRINNDPEQ